MSVSFTFALSQQQTFELRCDYGSRRLDKVELLALIEQCEENYYSKESDRLSGCAKLNRGCDCFSTRRSALSEAMPFAQRLRQEKALRASLRDATRTQ